jgi:hypothetical protein
LLEDRLAPRGIWRRKQAPVGSPVLTMTNSC